MTGGTVKTGCPREPDLVPVEEDAILLGLFLDSAVAEGNDFLPFPVLCLGGAVGINCNASLPTS